MSSKVRKDRKGRILRVGERQEADGRYSFRYTDANGKRHAIYSWRLVATDHVPLGKRGGEDLRTWEAQIRREIEDGLQTHTADKMRVNDLFDLFVRKRTDLEESTLSGYVTLYNKHIRNILGNRSIKHIRHIDIYNIYSDMVHLKGLRISTVMTLNSCVGQMFQLAIENRWLNYNPAVGATTNLLSRDERFKQVKKSNALTDDQRDRFLSFVSLSSRFSRMYNLFVTLFGMGLRISEAIGLTEDKIDFNTGFLRVEQELSYRQGMDHHYKYVYHPFVKSEAGIRVIPMSRAVRDALRAQVKAARSSENFKKFSIDGVCGFIFLNKEGKPFSPQAVYSIMQDIIAAYNQKERDDALKEGRSAEYLPKFGPHCARHTFCSYMNNNNVNPATIRDIMGHKNIAVQNTYTHKTPEQLMSDMCAIDAIHQDTK